MFSPSTISAGTVGAAVSGLPTHSPWESRQRLIEKLCDITNVDIELLRECIELVESTLHANLGNISSSQISTDSNDVTTGSGSLNKFDSSSGRYVRATDDGDRGDGNTPTDVCDVML